MTWKERLAAMLGFWPKPIDDEARVILDRGERAQAERLSRLTGRRRDEVLAESYRRADKLLAGKVKPR